MGDEELVQTLICHAQDLSNQRCFVFRNISDSISNKVTLSNILAYPIVRAMYCSIKIMPLFEIYFACLNYNA